MVDARPTSLAIQAAAPASASRTRSSTTRSGVVGGDAPLAVPRSSASRRAASRRWYRAAKARALVGGRDYAVPDDFKEAALPALAHRVVTRRRRRPGEPLGRAREEAERVLAELLERVAVPS